MMKLKVPLQAFLVDPCQGDGLVPAEISLTVGVSDSGSGIWLGDLDKDSERRSEGKDYRPTKLDAALGFEESFRLPSETDWAHARVHVLGLRQTGEADPVLLGGQAGTIPMGGFLSCGWCLRLEIYSGLLTRILVPDLDTLTRITQRVGPVSRLVWRDTYSSTRITQRVGPVSRLVWRDTYSSVPHHVAIARLVEEWTPRGAPAAPNAAAEERWPITVASRIETALAAVSPGGMTRTSLRSLLSSHVDTWLINTAIAALMSSGRIRRTTNTLGGRSLSVYRLVEAWRLPGRLADGGDADDAGMEAS